MMSKQLRKVLDRTLSIKGRVCENCGHLEKDHNRTITLGIPGKPVAEVVAILARYQCVGGSTKGRKKSIPVKQLLSPAVMAKVQAAVTKYMKVYYLRWNKIRNSKELRAVRDFGAAKKPIADPTDAYLAETLAAQCMKTLVRMEVCGCSEFIPLSSKGVKADA